MITSILYSFSLDAGKTWGNFGIVPACLLGIALPHCMYGTIPIAASFSLQELHTLEHANDIGFDSRSYTLVELDR